MSSFTIRCVQRVSAETQLNASEGNIAGKGGKGSIGGIGGTGGRGGRGGKGGKGGIGGRGGIGDKRGKGDRRDLPKRHQSFSRILTWCPAVCVTENNGSSPSPSSAIV